MLEKKQHVLIFQVTPEFKNKLTEIAEKDGRTISSLSRKILSDFLINQKGKYTKNEKIN